MNTGHNAEAMRLLWQPTRPYRIIYSLYMEIEPLPTEPPESTRTLIVHLDRQGMGTGRAKPRPPKMRAIDLRAGDETLARGRWRTIKAITAYRDNWMSEERAAAYTANDGYIYRPA
jgi:hypothetical protein